MPAQFESGIMVGKSAWHGGGNVIPADDDRRFDIAACIELAGLDWTVTKGEAYFAIGDCIGKVNGSYVTLRQNPDGSHDPLGIVGSRYNVLQNREAFDWFQPWLDTKELAIETAGSLEEGKSVWVLARILRGNVTVDTDDEIAKYLMLSTRHDGLASTACGFTPIRIECANLLAMAHGSKASKLLRVRHTESQHQALNVIRETIDLVDQQFEASGEQYRRMLECNLSPSELRRYVKLVHDVDPEVAEKDLSSKMRNRIDQICNLALSGRGQSGDCTVWSAYNGVTEYLSHHNGKDGEKRMKSNMEGQGAKLNQRAFNLAVELSA